MVSLFEDVVLFLGRKQSVGQLAAEAGVPDAEAARVGVVLSLPVAIANLGQWVEDPVNGDWLAVQLAAVGPASATDLGALLADSDLRDAGAGVLDLALGGAAPSVTQQIAARAEIAPESADELLAITTSAMLAHLAHRYRGVVNSEGLMADLAYERAQLDEGGWGPWIHDTLAVAEPVVARAPDPVTAPDDAALLDYPPPAARRGRTEPDPFPEPVHTAPYGAGEASDLAVGHDDWGSDVLDDGPQRDVRVPPPAREASHGGHEASPAARRRRPAADVERRDPSGRGLRGPAGLILLAGLAIVCVLLIIALTSTGTDGPAGDVVADGSVTSVAETETAGGDDSASDDDTEPGTSSTVAPLPTGPVMIAVPLDDPLGRTEGTGTATLTLDPQTGEVCYEFDVDGVAAPYDGHIHVGPAGVKGGIVVDFGELTGAPSACFDNNPTDISAIVNDLAGHYVEFHDADEVTTVRAQLAEPDPNEVAQPGAGETDEDGAYVRIEAGSLILVGDVPDQVTIDKFIETFADIDLGATELVSQLEIVPGAPRPSGRIVVDDAILFEFDSSDLSDPEGTVLLDLATIFKARPAWTMTVVGHTDSVGTDVYNLELSLRRASAVRDALIAAGVSADALTIEGAGSTSPIAPNDTVAGRIQNRRIEIEVVPG